MKVPFRINFYIDANMEMKAMPPLSALIIITFYLVILKVDDQSLLNSYRIFLRPLSSLKCVQNDFPSWLFLLFSMVAEVSKRLMQRF